MSDTSPVLSLPLIQPAQAQKHVTHNEALLILDALVQLAVLSATETAPPAAPETGARYIVAAPAAGDWAGHAGEIAVYRGGAWAFVAPQPGWRAQVLDTGGAVVFGAGGSWLVEAAGAAESLPRLGVNTAADAVNRLSVRAAATLLSHAGAGHQLKLNKAAPGETASLLYQTGFSGRAEMGLAGDDAFAVKVSADGASWHEALRADPAAGSVDFPQGASAAGAPLLSRAELLGPVSEAAGLPTGAVIERGSNANGAWVRFADGTQICTRQIAGVDTDVAAGAIFRSAPTGADFPMAFAPGSAVTGSGSAANTGLIWVNGRAANETNWTYTAFSYLSRTGDTIALMAIGRWF